MKSEHLPTTIQVIGKGRGGGQPAVTTVFYDTFSTWALQPAARRRRTRRHHCLDQAETCFCLGRAMVG